MSYNKGFETRDIILIGVFAALMSVGAYVSIPIFTVPITLQLLFALLAGGVLGSKKGAMSMLIYMIIGLIGIPVFSQATGGVHSVLKHSFGYIIGFIFTAYFVGLIVENTKNKILIYIAPFVGVLIDYIIGVPYLYMIFNTVLNDSISVNTALEWGLYPFILVDLLKALAAGIIIAHIVPVISKISIRKSA